MCFTVRTGVAGRAISAKLSAGTNLEVTRLAPLAVYYLAAPMQSNREEGRTGILSDTRSLAHEVIVPEG